MGGILDTIMNAAPGAAAARGGYLTGQQQQKQANAQLERQSLLDQINMDHVRSETAANNALVTERNNKSPLERIYEGQDGPVIVNSDGKGGTTPLLDALGNRVHGKPKAGPTLKDPNVVNPSAGTIEDVYTDGSRKTVRKATAAEIARATHVPRDGNEPPPMSPNARETMASNLADSAVEAVGGDPGKAMEWMTTNGEYDKAKAAQMTRRHYYEAAARFKTKKDAADALAASRKKTAGGLGGLLDKYGDGGDTPTDTKPAATVKPQGTARPAAPVGGKPEIDQDKFEYLTAPKPMGAGLTPDEVNRRYTVRR